MAVIESKQFGYPDLTPHCNDCGVPMCWDISQEEYDNNRAAWDNWICEYCSGQVSIKNSYENAFD